MSLSQTSISCILSTKVETKWAREVKSYKINPSPSVEPVKCCGVTDITPKRLTYGTQSYGSYLYTAYRYEQGPNILVKAWSLRGRVLEASSKTLYAGYRTTSTYCYFNIYNFIHSFSPECVCFSILDYNTITTLLKHC